MWVEAALGTLTVAALILHWCSSHGKRRSAVKGQEKIKGADSKDFDRQIRAKNVLIAISHPDDECLFFAPTILGLTRGGSNVHLLCLSAGGYRGLGLLRKVELRHSCQILGVNIGNVTVVEHSNLPDDPNAKWSKRIVRGILLKYCTHLNIDTLITFDDFGVSGHANHRALYFAAEHLYRKGMLLPQTSVFVLQSVNLARKYSGVIDILASFIDGSTHIYVNNYFEVCRSWRAMWQHRTQLVWFRWLYMVFSRYMIMNTLRRVTTTDHYSRAMSDLREESGGGGRGSRNSSSRGDVKSRSSSVTSSEI